MSYEGITKEDLETMRKNGMSLGEEQQLFWKKEDYLEETPIECYVKRNGETIKFVRYEEIERLHSIIKEVREYCKPVIVDGEEKELCVNGKDILEILDKENKEW